jgi:hypothetical protein
MRPYNEDKFVIVFAGYFYLRSPCLFSFDQRGYRLGANPNGTANTHYGKPSIVDHPPHGADADIQDLGDLGRRQQRCSCGEFYG